MDIEYDVRLLAANDKLRERIAELEAALRGILAAAEAGYGEFPTQEFGDSIRAARAALGE